MHSGLSAGNFWNLSLWQMTVSTFIHRMFVIYADENWNIIKKSKKKVLAIDNAPFDSHFEQNSKFKFSVSLSNISKEVTSSNSKELERALDEITTKFVLASESNFGYYA